MNEQVNHEELESTSAGDARRKPISRRFFLKGSSAAVASTAVATVGVAHHALAQDATPMPDMSGTPTPTGATGSVETTATTFFTADEAATVDALVSRLMPGSADDPGAHEARVVDYIDRQLHGANLGYDLKTYIQGPFLVTSDQATPVEQTSARDQYVSIPIATDLVSRYGYQSTMTPQQVYRRGIGFVNGYAQSKFQKNFADLSADQQDAILTDMAGGKTSGFTGPTDIGFFAQLRNDTIEGMFSDPMYGGNQNFAGWNLIKYPGAQHFYSADEMKNGTTKAPQSLTQMIGMESQG